MVAIEAMGRLRSSALDAFRRTGADVPGGDPRPSHGAEMEGYFWRITSADQGLAAVALCGVNRRGAGRWATVAVAVHPGDAVRSAAVEDASDDPHRLAVRAGAVLEAGPDRVHAELDGIRVDLEIGAGPAWPLRLPGGGVAGVVPGLGQYWHPHLLGVPARGAIVVDGRSEQIVDGRVYAEKNWGRGFPDRWWWGEAHDFVDADVAVAFGGGRLTAGPAGVDITGLVCRIDDRVLRLAPPLALVRAVVDADGWHIRGRNATTEVVIEGRAAGSTAMVLPVPLPAEGRNVFTDFEHQGGQLHLEVRRRGRVVFAGTSELAALEVGTRPDPPVERTPAGPGVSSRRTGGSPSGHARDEESR